MKPERLLLTLFLIIMFSGCTEDSGITPEATLSIITQKGEVNVDVEIADTPKEIQTGLMDREKLGISSGMLFVFPTEERKSFWMKDTLIPLDMIFISSNGTITEIKEDVQPCTEDPCPTYPSRYPIQYVLELNSGFSQKRNVQIGDTLNLTLTN